MVAYDPKRTFVNVVRLGEKYDSYTGYGAISEPPKVRLERDFFQNRAHRIPRLKVSLLFSFSSNWQCSQSIALGVLATLKGGFTRP